MNAHSHLMAMMLSTSEVIPVVDGELALGTWQSILFFELDGPRKRTVFVQISGD
jgi:secondary thiamine-phosphate synthase enzyme